MKESDTLAANATIKQHLNDILLTTKGKYMKESNTLADNAANNSPKREILLDTKNHFMKFSNNLVGKSQRTENKWIKES